MIFENTNCWVTVPESLTQEVWREEECARIGIYSKLPSDADAAGLGTTLRSLKSGKVISLSSNDISQKSLADIGLMGHSL